ncbi:MAG TPA: GntR family transcriptional regulator [Longimicrobiales bacterium]|nr:GntR family transcriptional regulator [Longimicrobiales bacterium]
MSRDLAAGAAVLQKLRERITSGCYLGYWQPGQRLPSIRTVAMREGVDRKTAAAAYRHLQEEGRVEVHPRSGVYLRAAPLPAASDPLERLHRQWLAHAYEGARSLGLDTGSILRFVNAVADIERMRVPVVECDWAQAELVARELRTRLRVRASPYLLEELRPGDPALAEAPVIVTTPYHVGELLLLVPGARVVEATLAPGIFRELAHRLADGDVLLVTATRSQREKLAAALVQHLPIERHNRVRLVTAENRAEIEPALQSVSSVFLWPGTPDWVESSIPMRQMRFRPSQYLSEDSITLVQAAILHAAIRRVRAGTRAELVSVR